MVFSSLEFIFWFLPFFLFVYFLMPVRYRNIVVFVFSMLFYAYGALDKPAYILLLLCSILVNYTFGMLIGRSRNHKKAFLAAGLIYDFGALFIFKYTDFFIGNINAVISNFSIKPLPAANLLLPIGISFYTFQAASYLIDVYRSDVPAEKSPLKLGTYIVMFPQLIAGPIVRFSDVRADLKDRICTRKKFVSGIAYFVFGLGYKVLLANRLSGLWQGVAGIGYESVSVPLAWMGIIAYSLQIYFDFYGYSLMAIGLGKMIGFSFPQNFNYPYISRSMTEFWRRWHITLGTWFREYVYIPLGGNRKGAARTYFNLLCVWLLTGFWHGADWNFILWGLFLFAVIAIEKAGLLKLLERFKIFSHIYMLLLIPLSWLVFALTDLSDIWIYLGRLFGAGGINVFEGDYISYLQQYGIFLLAGILLSTKLPKVILKYIRKKPIIMAAVLLAVFAGSVYCIYMGMNDPFLYFRF